MGYQSVLFVTNEGILVEDELWEGPLVVALARRHKRLSNRKSCQPLTWMS